LDADSSEAIMYNELVGALKLARRRSLRLGV